MNNDTNPLPEEKPVIHLSQASPKRRNASPAAFQTVLCLLICCGSYAANLAFPDVTEALFEEFCALAHSAENTLPNPIRIVEEWL